MATEAHVPSISPVSAMPSTSRFANREVSWLDFNARVLALAEDNDRPLLERVRFLSIFSTNLDEFFQIRVAGLREQLSVGLATTSPDGMTTREQLDAINERVRVLMTRQHQIWAKSVRPRLAAAGIGVAAILSARSADLVMSGDLFAAVGAEIIPVLDSDGTSAVENVEAILRRLITEGRADAFFTCGSNRLMQLLKRLGREHAIPGQVAMEQVMACGFGPCYVCVKAFEVAGARVLRRVCVEGPVFDLQEAVGW